MGVFFYTHDTPRGRAIIISPPGNDPGHTQNNLPGEKGSKYRYRRLNESYPLDVKNALFIGIAQKEPGTPLFLPCFSQAMARNFTLPARRVIEAERDSHPRSPAARLASPLHLQRGHPGIHNDEPGPHAGK